MKDSVSTRVILISCLHLAHTQTSLRRPALVGNEGSCFSPEENRAQGEHHQTYLWEWGGGTVGGLCGVFNLGCCSAAYQFVGCGGAVNKAFLQQEINYAAENKQTGLWFAAGRLSG